jgi:aspartyl-tRNA(Asn)/glutamyl-tRNA(Gln) amidotransferase subunit A
LFDVVSGYDAKDAKSVQRDDTKQRYEQLQRPDLKGIKCALPRQFMDEHLDSEIKTVCLDAIELLKKL